MPKRPTCPPAPAPVPLGLVPPGAGFLAPWSGRRGRLLRVGESGAVVQWAPAPEDPAPRASVVSSGTMVQVDPNNP